MSRHWGVRLLLGSFCLGLATGVPASSNAQSSVARRAQALIAGLDFDEARRVLSAADGDDPLVLLERARLAIDELDCDGAAAILARPDVERVEGGDQLADIAHGCQRVTAGLASDRDEARGVDVFWQDEHDRALAPLLFETVAQAREALTRDLGVTWPLPTRVVVVRDLLSLSAMTGLPYESARTTGTVAVAKWGRVTLLSPRASRHGYPWRDTIAHELTHLAVTRASRDQAPLWLQEGIAKREESRWRSLGPFDDRPPADDLVRRGLDVGLGIPLDKLGPSIAMLPSADAASVAFAEVTSFVRFYAQTEDAAGAGGGPEALPKLLAELREQDDPDQALSAASGLDLKAWDERWRASIAARPPAVLPELLGLVGPKSAVGSKGGAQAAREAERLRDLRDRARLAQLLLSRAHAPEALSELDRIELAAAPASNEGWERAMGDPSVRWLRGRALEEAGRRDEGESLMADPAQVLSSYGPWWATRGRWARLRGDERIGAESFDEAVAADPLDEEAACEAIGPNAVLADPAKAALCAAARARQEPPFDAD
jgi:hypothetical protein